MALSPNFQLNPCTLCRLQFLRFKSAKPIHKPNPYVKIQSIPPKWIQSWKPPPKPLRKPLKSALDYRNSTTSDDEDVVGTSRSTGSSTMERIVEKLKKFGYIDESRVKKDKPLPEKGSIEDIFYVEDGMLPNSRGGVSINVEEEARFPWEKNNVESLANERRKRSKSSVAELTLPEGELRRLRHLAIRMKSKIRVKGAGATKEIVDLIHEKWMTEEVVRIKCEGASALNMKRMHEILERKTGGLVIWRSGSSMSLYRGVTYETPQPVKKPYQNIQLNEVKTSTYTPLYFPTEINQQTMQDVNQSSEKETMKTENIEPSAEIKYESEMDALLDPLGPRYKDWSGPNPLPVDADMLPGIIPGYKPPFRVLPYGVRPGLGYKDGTALRRLARVLPPHFALGRSRLHQGLAAAIVKLWESSSIVKIALKRGVQLTTSERMAEDIKKLTGGSILSRNKDFIVFYRGKDFLSSEVTEALLERERMAKTLQDEEEQARLKASSSFVSNTEKTNEPCNTGTLEETLAANARFGSKIAEDHADKMTRAAEAAKHADLVRKLERKLLTAEGKLSKAEKVLSKVEQSLKPVKNTTDPDSITDEERFMFRKLGLKMKAFLLLGRRGVFDGTVENMHLHWKYRELVKILVKAKSFLHVKNIALALEAESGGVLVSVDKISKGFAIIVYRGNGYVRPSILRPKNLLTKRKALARSIELQRHEALSHHITTLRKRVEKLRSELGQIEDVKEQGNADLYSKLDSAYATGDDEDTEDDECDEDYLEIFNSAVDVDSDEVDEDDSYDSYSDRDDKNDDNEDTVKDETVFDSSELCI